ncbi:hypothetical protein ALQ74_103337 [Pseudomonas savastanoi pv. glycinea]|uniref:Uncharacterized protein n=2 Tax=Pseudomonas savastanoi TaxID=29438 RepID=A0A3M6DTY0_PSESG|nr:hypothetical protein ALO55_103279 [Pseudomonas savastanoi pv. phaseolicola]RMM63069.1 hypothetical protein ALQ74_103337 [Pseudomonas savastanoi pv. glycinea]RMQ67695.1 hypothetical protein ALQ01_103339 [Pseudomonas savastanoi pv. glycinea]RMT13039.1 hypothetical protein ALP53_102937 [Pseudomonas savastanoi pv. phaseolicola]RMV59559.1 hypothetical protein ALP07_103802 [Pseudomonas savastanoi pv. glycinea]
MCYLHYWKLMKFGITTFWILEHTLRIVNIFLVIIFIITLISELVEKKIKKIFASLLS